jgi:hypothetical protein
MDSSRWFVFPFAWLENLATDLQYAIRALLKSPGFPLALIGALALGIGANAAIFTVVDTVLLHSLSYPESERIVRWGVPSRPTLPSRCLPFGSRITKFSNDLRAYVPVSGMRRSAAASRAGISLSQQPRILKTNLLHERID